eukprot:858921-Pyramimonas_sp.AAC.1
MDGLEAATGVLVLAATNRPQVRKSVGYVTSHIMLRNASRNDADRDGPATNRLKRSPGDLNVREGQHRGFKKTGRVL